MLQLGLSYAVAVVLRVTTLALAALGIVVQRKSHVINDAKPQVQQKSALRRPLWHLGFWLYVFSSIISDAVGISSLPLLVIALIGSLVLFFNAIYSHIILHEDMTRLGWVGTGIVAVSSTGLAILLNLPNSPKSVDELNNMIQTPGYIIYSALTLIALIILSAATSFCLKKRSRILKSVSDETLTSLITAKLERCNFWIALLYNASSTILASLAMAYAKISFELLQHSITIGENQFKNVVSISFLVVTVVATILQLILFNLSLHYYPTLFTIPFGYSVGIILACLNTLVYYDSFFVIPPWKSVLVVICVLSTIFGIYILSR